MDGWLVTDVYGLQPISGTMQGNFLTQCAIIFLLVSCVHEHMGMAAYNLTIYGYFKICGLCVAQCTCMQMLK